MGFSLQRRKKKTKGLILKGTIQADANKLFRFQFREIDTNRVIKIKKFTIAVSGAINGTMAIMKDFLPSLIDDVENITVNELNAIIGTPLNTSFDVYNNRAILLAITSPYNNWSETIELTDFMENEQSYIYDSLYFLMGDTTGLNAPYFIIEYDVVEKFNPLMELSFIADAIDILTEMRHMSYADGKGEKVVDK